MTTLSMVSMRSDSEAQSSIKIIALFSCIGLVASVCLMTFGVDLSAGWL
jgi:hypothetical protein